MIPRHLIVPAAFAAVFILAAAWISWPQGWEWQRAALAVIGIGLLVYTTVAGARHRAARRYDLASLRELHEQGGPPPEDHFGPMQDEPTILCRHCGAVYAYGRAACPKCGRS